MWWLYVLLGILIVLPIVFFSNSSNTKKRMDKDLEKKTLMTKEITYLHQGQDRFKLEDN